MSTFDLCAQSGGYISHRMPPLIISFDVFFQIAQNLRMNRLHNGALTLQKAKIEFDLPSTTFNPIPDSSVGEPETESVSFTCVFMCVWLCSHCSPVDGHFLITHWTKFSRILLFARG